MGVLLEIKAGPFAGQTIPLATGRSVVIGRAAGKAQFALPHDTFMSGAHFAVECGPQGCRAIDKKSSNGTFLNGARIQEAMLANGDEIKAGQTIFGVKIVADTKLASLAPAAEVSSPRNMAPPETGPVRGSAAPPAVRRSSPPAGRSLEESERGPLRAAPQPAPSARPGVAEPLAPAPVMRTATQSREAGIAGRPAPANPPASGASQNAPSGGLGSAPHSPVAPSAAAIPNPAVPPAARVAGKSPAPVFSVMGWSFFAIPEKWQIQEEFGLQRTGEDAFPSSVVATQELLSGITLQQFVESQISMLRGYLRDPKIEPTMPPRVGGAEESMAVDVRHSTKDGRELVYRRIYARSGASVGVLTVTTLATELPQVLQTLQPLLDGAAFGGAVNSKR